MNFCKFFGECPVCKYQGFPYEGSLEVKRKAVEEVLSSEVEVIPSRKHKGYRNRVILRVKKPEPGNFILGYTLRRGFVFGVDSCPILHPSLESLLKPLSAFFSRQDISVWDPRRRKGSLIGLTLLGDGGGVILSLNLRRRIFIKRLTFEILDRFPQILGVWWATGNFGEHLLGGRGDLFRTFRYGRYIFKVSPYGEYPDNLSILPSIWDILSRTLRGRVVSLMGGIYVPPNRVSTYVDKRGIVAKEVLETAGTYGVKPEVKYMEVGAFLMVNREVYDWAVVNADRVREKGVASLSENLVLIGGDVSNFKRITDRRPERVYLFDTLPYTPSYTAVAVYR